jgi:hypothetical protein
MSEIGKEIREWEVEEAPAIPAREQEQKEIETPQEAPAWEPKEIPVPAGFEV